MQIPDVRAINNSACMIPSAINYIVCGCVCGCCVVAASLATK